MPVGPPDDLREMRGWVGEQIAFGCLRLGHRDGAEGDGRRARVVQVGLVGHAGDEGVGVGEGGERHPPVACDGADDPGPGGRGGQGVNGVVVAVVVADGELGALEEGGALGGGGSLGVGLGDAEEDGVIDPEGLSDHALGRGVRTVDPRAAGIHGVGRRVRLGLAHEREASGGEPAVVDLGRGVLGEDEPDRELRHRLGVLASVALDGAGVAGAAVAVVEDVVECEATGDPAAEGLADPRRREVAVGAVGGHTGVVHEPVAGPHPDSGGVGLHVGDRNRVRDVGEGRLGGERPSDEAEQLREDEHC